MQGLSALRRLGLVDKVREGLDAPALAHYIFHGPTGDLLGVFGTVLWCEDAQDPSAVQSNKRNLHVSRQALRGLLFKEYDGVFCWNSRLVELREDKGMCLTFEDGTQSTADVVIGADGINSMVRKLAYPHLAPLEYLKVIVALGISSTSSNACFGSDDVIFESVDGRYRFYAMPHRESLDVGGTIKNDRLAACNDSAPITSYMWQLSFVVEDEQEALKLTSKDNHNKLIAMLLEDLQSWHQPVPELISNTPQSLFMAMPIYDRGVDACLSTSFRKGVWLIGDAIHPMSPFKGQGANQALLDAVELADLLAMHYQLLPADRAGCDKPKKKRRQAEACSGARPDADSAKGLEGTGRRDGIADESSDMIGPERMREFYEKISHRVASKILKSRERIKKYHTVADVLSVQTYCYGECVTPSFIAHLNMLSLNAAPGSVHAEPLYRGVKRELDAQIKNKIN